MNESSESPDLPTLPAFLEARWAEIEADADSLHNRHDDDMARLEFYGDCDCGHPAYVLADIAAKRAVLALHQDLAADNGEYSGWQNLAIDTLAALAAPFAAHDDYRAEWAL